MLRVALLALPLLLAGCMAPTALDAGSVAPVAEPGEPRVEEWSKTYSLAVRPGIELVNNGEPAMVVVKPGRDRVTVTMEWDAQTPTAESLILRVGRSQDAEPLAQQEGASPLEMTFGPDDYDFLGFHAWPDMPMPNVMLRQEVRITLLVEPQVAG